MKYIILFLIIASSLAVSSCLYDDAGAPDQNLWIGTIDYPYEGIIAESFYTQADNGTWYRLESANNTGGAVQLDDLTDVEIAGVEGGDMLVYSEGESAFVNLPPSDVFDVLEWGIGDDIVKGSEFEEHTEYISAHHARYTDTEARTAVVEDTAYGAGWDGDQTHAPSQNAVYDKIETMSFAVTASGNYDGNDTANRAIAHGLGKTPKLIKILSRTTATSWIEYTMNPNLAYIFYCIMSTATTVGSSYAVTQADSTNFYVGNASSYTLTGNASTRTYYWVAWG